MNIWQKLHAVHRFWRYRFSTERDSLTYLHALDLRNTLALDIGANKGAYSFWLSKAVGRQGQVWAFEPQPELAPYLKEIKCDFFLHNLRIFNCALSNDSGELKLDRKYAGHGGAKASTGGDLSVKSIKLDELLNEITLPIRFIKCDVEGHELEVLQGASELISKYQPILQIEIHHKAMEDGTVLSFLKSLNYEGFFLLKGRRLPIDQFDQHQYPRKDTHRNYVFVPHSH